MVSLIYNYAMFVNWQMQISKDGQRKDTMIDRIGNSYDYRPQQLNKKVQSDTETFSMDYARQDKTIPIDKEDEREKKEDSVIEALLKKSQEPDGGVKVELSKTSAQNVKKTSSDNSESMTGGIRERLKNLWSDIKAAFVKFFGGIEKVAEDDIAVVDTQEALREEDTVAEPPKTQAEIRQELLASLYENGEKNLARNSDLLTTYNKNGSFVQINAGDKNRILHMHPNQIDETF